VPPAPQLLEHPRKTKRKDILLKENKNPASVLKKTRF